jgi:hypothetical protein
MVQTEPTLRHLTLTELLVLSEARAAHLPAITELLGAVSVVMEEEVARRVHMELRGALGMDSEVIKMDSDMEVVVLLPARMELLVEAKTVLVAMEEATLDLVVAQVVRLHPLMELRVDLKMDLDVMAEAEHLLALMVPLEAGRMVLVVDHMEAESEVDLKLDLDIMEVPGHRPAVMELLQEIRMVLEVDLMEVVLRPALTELQAELRMDLVAMEGVGHLLILTELLEAVRAVLADLLQVLMELLVAVRAVRVDHHQVLTELLAVDREVPDRMAVEHLPVLMERLVADRTVVMVEVEHLLIRMVRRIVEAVASGLEMLLVPADLSLDLDLDLDLAADMEVARAKMDLL